MADRKTTGKRRKPEIRTVSGAGGPPRGAAPLEDPKASPAPEVPRSATGQWVQGGPSPCPGGRGLANANLARAIRDATNNGATLVQVHLAIVELRARVVEAHVVRQPGKESGEEIRLVERPPSVAEVQRSAEALRTWGWGKALSGSQLVLPEEVSLSPAATTPEALAARAGSTLARLLELTVAQAEGGMMPSAELLGALGTTASAVATLQKEAREAAKEAAEAERKAREAAEEHPEEELVAAAMAETDPDVVGQALAALPPERRQAVVDAMKRAQAQEAASDAK